MEGAVLLGASVGDPRWHLVRCACHEEVSGLESICSCRPFALTPTSGPPHALPSLCCLMFPFGFRLARPPPLPHPLPCTRPSLYILASAPPGPTSFLGQSVALGFRWEDRGTHVELVRAAVRRVACELHAHCGRFVAICVDYDTGRIIGCSRARVRQVKSFRARSHAIRIRLMPATQ